MHVEFTLTGSCPVMCTYCPQFEFITAYSRQSVQTTSLNDFWNMLSNVSVKVCHNKIHFGKMRRRPLGFGLQELDSNLHKLLGLNVQGSERCGGRQYSILSGEATEDERK